MTSLVWCLLMSLVVTCTALSNVEIRKVTNPTKKFTSVKPTSRSFISVQLPQGSTDIVNYMKRFEPKVVHENIFRTVSPRKPLFIKFNSKVSQANTNQIESELSGRASITGVKGLNKRKFNNQRVTLNDIIHGRTSYRQKNVRTRNKIRSKPVIRRNVYAFSLPRTIPKKFRQPELPTPKVEYNVIFLKTADQQVRANPIVIPPATQRTKVFVLNQNPKPIEQEVIEVPFENSSPEVFYINYNEEENPMLPGGARLQTILNNLPQQNVQSFQTEAKSLPQQSVQSHLPEVQSLTPQNVQTLLPEVQSLPVQNVQTLLPEVQSLPPQNVQTLLPEVQSLPVQNVQTLLPEVPSLPVQNVQTLLPEVKSLHPQNVQTLQYEVENLSQENVPIIQTDIQLQSAEITQIHPVGVRNENYFKS